jgi:DNA gyrase/topoisomerase IV subunit B
MLKLMSGDELIERMRARPGMYIGGLTPCGVVSITAGLIVRAISNVNRATERVAVLIVGAQHAIVQIGEAAEAELLQKQYPLDGIFMASVFSEVLTIESVQNGFRETQQFSRGRPLTKRSVEASDSRPFLRIEIVLDRQLFPSDVSFSFYSLTHRLKGIAISNRETAFSLEDRQQNLRYDFRYPDGLMTYLLEYGVVPYKELPIHLELSEVGESVEAVVCEWVDVEMAVSFVNGQQMRGNGSHVDRFLDLYSHARQVQAFGRHFSRKSLFLLMALQLNEPHYAGATRERLGDDRRASELIDRIAHDQLPAALERWMQSWERR